MMLMMPASEYGIVYDHCSFISVVSKCNWLPNSRRKYTIAATVRSAKNTTVPKSAQARLRVTRAGITRNIARSRSDTTYVPAARLYRFREIIVISSTVDTSTKTRYALIIGTYGSSAALLMRVAMRAVFMTITVMDMQPIAQSIAIEFIT